MNEDGSSKQQVLASQGYGTYISIVPRMTQQEFYSYPATPYALGLVPTSNGNGKLVYVGSHGEKVEFATEFPTGPNYSYSAIFSPTGKTVVLARKNGDQYSVYLLKVDGSVAREFPGDFAGLMCSDDQTAILGRIAEQTNGGHKYAILELVDLQGGEVHQLPVEDSSGNFTANPDCSRIWSQHSTSCSYSMVNTLNGIPKEIDNTYCWGLTLSPDYAHLLFERWSGNNDNLFVASADQTNEIMLGTVPVGSNRYFHAGFSENGSRLAFQGWDESSHTQSVYVADSNGSNLQKLIEVPYQFLADNQNLQIGIKSVRMSADGNWLAVYQQETESQSHYYLFQRDGKKIELPHGTDDAWVSPTGKYVVFCIGERCYTGNLLTQQWHAFFDSVGTNERFLYNFMKSWYFSSDERKFIFQVETIGEVNHKIYIADSETGQSQIVADGHAFFDGWMSP